jgi:hypothetical protein
VVLSFKMESSTCSVILAGVGFRGLSLSILFPIALRVLATVHSAPSVAKEFCNAGDHYTLLDKLPKGAPNVGIQPPAITRQTVMLAPRIKV